MRRMHPLLSSVWNQRPFLRNSSVNAFPLLGNRYLIMQKLGYKNGNGVFLRGPCQGVSLEKVGAPNELRVVS
jgi:hypothetical protein